MVTQQRFRAAYVGVVAGARRGAAFSIATTRNSVPWSATKTLSVTLPSTRFDRLKDQKRKLAPDAFDLILANPRFGAMVKETEKGMLSGGHMNLGCPARLWPSNSDIDNSSESSYKIH
jgi:hypothetical protein